ncbi:MAG: imidazolonepropionase-like amidohydrolase [Saprospiraceae bacterium]|jgi:imidazolonepropionase-like amidohydrolase
MKYFINTFFFCLLAVISIAQQTPAPNQSQAIAILGATAHIGNGKVINNSLITFDKGKITNVADATTIRIDRGQFGKIIDASGKHVYPGFITANTRLGLIEIGAVGATRDAREIGYINPNLRAIVAYNTDSEVVPTVRSNGVLLAQIVPQGGRISGQSTVVELDAWNWEDAAYKLEDGIHLNWPSISSWSWTTRSVSKNKDYDKQIKEVEDYMAEAKAYVDNKSHSNINLKFEAMKGLFEGSKKLYIHTNDIKTITQSVLIAKQYDLTPVIVGGRDSWMITDFLKENKVAILLHKTHDLPPREDADIDQPFKTAVALEKAGVLYAFHMDDEPMQERNLPFQAGQAVGFGLDKEAAISALTLNTAKILGIDKTVGSLEIGKDATLFISTGDALDYRTNKVEAAFIRGKEISLDDKQKVLYRKYSEKYGHEIQE